MGKKDDQRLKIDIINGLASILTDTEKIKNRIKQNHPRIKQPFLRCIGNKGREFICYHAETETLYAFYRDKEGVLYEISVFKRE